MTRCRPLVSGRGAFAAVLVSFALAACATDVPPPTAQIGASSQAILNAERAGAAQYAPAELHSARAKMAAADAAMRADNRIEARRLAEEAQADANFAAAKAQNLAAQQAATTVRRDLQATRQGALEPYGATPVAPPYAAGSAGSSMGVTTTVPPATVPPASRGPTSWSPQGLTQGGTTTTTTTTITGPGAWTPDTTTSVEAGKSVSVGVPR